MRRGRWFRGLRARLVVAFVAVAVIGVVVASWASAAVASEAFIAATERNEVSELTSRVTATAPGLTFPPDQASLDALRAAVGGDTLITYGDLRSEEGGVGALIDDSFRTAVGRDRQTVIQTVVDQGRSWAVIGTPVMLTAVDGSRRPSGVDVYAARDLGDVQSQIDGLIRSALLIALVSLLLAVVTALVVARGVLRPVVELRDTALRLADGDLEARALPRGADELGDLAVTLNRMAESVRTSVEALRTREADARRFAADVSHELRTPLGTLTAATELIAETADELEPAARESVGLAVSETQRLVTLVEELMEVSRIDAGTARVRPEPVALAESVMESLRMRGWRERVEVTVDGDRVLRTDRRRLDLVLANLVANALRHGAPPLRVRISADLDRVRIEVTDRGPGIAARPVDRVFERFYKADDARSSEGSGLGLALARENARLLGGEIVAENRANGGARFVLTLPLGHVVPPDEEECTAE